MKITDKHILEAKQLLEQRKAEYWIQQGVVSTLEKIFLRYTEESNNATESAVSDDGSNRSGSPSTNTV